MRHALPLPALRDDESFRIAGSKIWQPLAGSLEGATSRYWITLRKMGFTMASIRAAISSAGMRPGVWYHWRAAP